MEVETMCDVRKYSDMYKDMKALQPEQKTVKKEIFLR